MSSAVQPASMEFAPTESQLAMAYAVCGSITRRAAKNFYYAFLVLPPAKRKALCAIYAYMRRCDDLSDDSTLPIRERRVKLDAWIDTFHRAQAGYPSDDPVLLALVDAQRRYDLPPELLDHLAHGTAADLADAPASTGHWNPGNPGDLGVRYRNFGEVYEYCYGVASVVGLVCIKVFGYRDGAAEALAERCGIGFQLTNIIRDVKEDAAMGRIYFAEEDLLRFELSPTDFRMTSDPGRFQPILSSYAERAREYYRSGEELIPFIAEDSQPALWVLVHIYRALLEKIAARNYDVFSERVSLSVREKLTILGKGFLRRLF